MKTIFFLITTVMITTSLFAQKISIGGEIGAISSINTDYKVSDFENRRNTYYAGLNLNYNYTEKITFSTGLHYLQQGYKHKTCYLFEEGVKNELVGKLDYILLPVSVSFNLGRLNRLITTIGIYGGINVNARQDYPKPIGGCKVYYPKDISSSTSKFIFGGFIGVGFKIYESEKIVLKPMLKYYQGLSNSMSNNHSYDIEWKDKYSSLLVTFTLDYKL